MRLAIYAVGRLKSGPERELFDRYLSLVTRAGTQIGLSVAGAREISESRRPGADERKKSEAADLLGAVADGAFIVALDETGRDLSSDEFARTIERKMHEGVVEMAFLVGGPDGHGDRVRQRADLALRLGKMTWPHRLARIMLAEQLFRSITVLSGHPYHRH